MTRSISPTVPRKTTIACVVVFFTAIALLVTWTPCAYAAKATTGSGATKAVYTYDKSTGTATYKACKAEGESATVPATITIKGKSYAVNCIAAKAFAKSKAKTITVHTKKLSKARTKNALKKSKVTKVKVKVGTTPANNKYAAKYKKYFTKANAGKKATVKTVKVKATAKQKKSIAKTFAKAYYTHWTYKNGTFATIDAEKAIAPYLAANCNRDEGFLDAAPFFQYADVTDAGGGLFIVKAYCYFTQSEVTASIWNAQYKGTTPYAVDLRITLNKYGLVTSIVA